MLRMELCPICSKGNECNKESCWCFQEEFPSEIFKLLPAAELERSCICKECLVSFKKSQLEGGAIMSPITNTEEYDHPILYDKENTQTNDLPFILKWASKTTGVIIDLACGTGRVTIPLARAGYQLIGVDIHRSMLEEARTKAQRENLNIEWELQDCTKLDWPVQSQLIYSVGNSFQHFLTNEDQDALLLAVNKHLQTNGVFIFDTRFPNEEELLQPSNEEYWRSYIDKETQNKVDVYTSSSYHSISQIQHYLTIRKSKNLAGDVIAEKRTNIHLRYTFPQEMNRLLTMNGFEILAIYQDWNETHLTNASDNMIYVCRKVKDLDIT